MKHLLLSTLLVSKWLLSFGTEAEKKVMNNHTAKVLVIGPLTIRVDSRLYPISDETRNVFMGGLLAAYHCNTGSGVLVEDLRDIPSKCPGLNIDFEFTDSELQPSRVMETFVKDMNVDFIVGTPRSSSSQPLALVAGALDIPVIGYAATSIDLDSRSTYPLYSRTVESDNFRAYAIANLANLYGLSHLGMIYIDDSYGASFRDSLLGHCNTFGIRLHAIGYRNDNVDSCKFAVQSLNNAKLNVIFVLSFSYEFKQILEEMMRLGMYGEGRLLIFTDSVSDVDFKEFSSMSAAHANFLHRQQYVRSTAASMLNPSFKKYADYWRSAQVNATEEMLDYIGERSPGGRKFRTPSNYNIEMAKFPRNPFNDNYFGNTFSPYAYDAVAAICKAICSVFEREGNISGSAVYAEQFNAEFAFEGISGHVALDKDTGSRTLSTANFEVVSILSSGYTDGTVEKAQIGHWVDGSWILDREILRFPPGERSEFPVDSTPPKEQTHSVAESTRIISILFLVILEVLCLVIGPWLIYHRKSKRLVNTQPRFLAIVVLGIAISSFSLIFTSLDDSRGWSQRAMNFGCNMMVWLWSIGSTITCSGLITKQYRVWKIFDNPSLRKRKIEDGFLYAIILGLTGFSILLLVVWHFVSPLYFLRVVVEEDSFGNTVESYGACTGGTGALVFLCVIVAFHFVLLFAASRIAFKVRLVDSKFQESQQIFIAVFGTAQLYLICLLMALAINSEQTELRALLLTLLVSFTNLGMLILTTLPRIIDFYIKPPPRPQTTTERTNLTGSGSEQQSDSRKSIFGLNQNSQSNQYHPPRNTSLDLDQPETPRSANAIDFT